MTDRLTFIEDYPDTISIEDFIGRVLSDHSVLKQEILRARRGKSKIFVANVGNTMQAVAITHDSTWHPNCTYVRLAYDFNQMTEDFLHQIIMYIKREYKKLLFFLVDYRYNLLIKVLRKNQFSLIRETEILHINPLKSLTKMCVLPSIHTVAEIKKDPTILSSLIVLTKQVYTDTHLANPVADLSFASWERAIMDGLLEKNSYVIVQDSNVPAFSLMYEVNEQRWELGWIGVRDRKNISELDKLLQLQTKDAVKCGIQIIEKESDSTCPYSQHVKKSWMYSVDECLYSYLG